VSLLGRLEDLSLTDIIQIVFLSRRTGVLEVVDQEGRHTILFRNGLIIGATSPEHPSINSAAMSREQLGEAIRNQVLAVITPLLHSREGEFNFLLEEHADLAYDPDTVFREGGLSPERILSVDGEKLKPLRGLEESLRAGKALRRSDAPADNVILFPQKAAETESAEEPARVVLFERDPVIRVAVRRAFDWRGEPVAQFGTLEEAGKAIFDRMRANEFFVSFLEAGEGTLALLQQVKRKNPRLPVVVIDNAVDLRRRHDLLQAGLDFYLTTPAAAEEQLRLFSHELVLLAEREFVRWEALRGAHGADAGRRFYEDAQKQQLDRTFNLLKHLIDQLSSPGEIGDVAATILRVAAEYLDRGALFIVSDEGFDGLDGFGITGGGEDMDQRVRRLRLRREEPSILNDVAGLGEAHRGKMLRTAANVELMKGLGEVLPSEVIALPIVHQGRTIGILYGDNAEHHAPIDSVSGLEIFLSQAGSAFGSAVRAAER
jgi:CheY-like chemotaxis protein